MTTQNTTPTTPAAPTGLPPSPARRINRLGIVLRKEWRDIFRDRRTTFGVIISPLVINPLLFALMGSVISGQTQQARVETYPVGLVHAQAAPDLRRALEGVSNLSITEVTRTEAEARVRDRRLRAAAVLPEDAEARLRARQPVPVQILFDAGNETSRDASERLRAAFDAQGEKIVAARLRESRLPPGLATPFQVTDQPVPGGGTVGGFMLAMFLPYVLTISAIAGAMHAANDMVAGEKERGTLETLLVSPASRRDLVLGKFGAVAGVCLVSSFLAVIGILLPFYLPLKAYAWLARGGLSLSAGGALVTLLVQFPLAMLFAGLLLAISTFARNQKEAQTYLGPLLILVLVPAMMSMLMKAEASPLLALVPVLNATLVLKQALSGVFDPLFIVVAFASSAAYAGLAILFATRLFEKESVLLKV